MRSTEEIDHYADCEDTEAQKEEWLEYYGPHPVRCRTCTHLKFQCICKTSMASNNTVKKVVLKMVRLSFPSVFKAETSFEGQEPKFEATFLLRKDDPQLKMLREAVKEVAKEKWGDTHMPKDDKLCVFDGNKKEYDGYADMIAVKASSQRRPAVLNRDKSPIVESDGIIYAGCYVNAAIGLWAQDNKFGKRINAFLEGVQFAAAGEPFGSSFDADSTFEDLTGGANDETQDKPATGPGSDDDLPF